MRKQGDIIIATKAFAFKAPGSRGRAVNVKIGDKFWITNCGTDQNRFGHYMIDRNGKGCISHGYAFPFSMVEEYFA